MLGLGNSDLLAMFALMRLWDENQDLNGKRKEGRGKRTDGRRDEW